MDSVNEQEPYASAHAYGNRHSSTARSTPSSSEHGPSHDRLSHHRHRSSRTPPRRYPPRFRQSTPPYAARYISDEAGVLDDGYAHPAEQEVSASDSAHLPPHHRRRHHRSTRHHRHRDLSSNGSHRSSLLSHHDDVDDDGYFLSAVSGQPSLEVDDLHADGDAGTPAATDGEATVGEEYALPTWPPGSSRLVEHRSPTAMIEDEEEGEVAEAVVGFFGRPTEALRSSTTMMPLPAAAAAAVAGTTAAAPAVVPTAPLPPFATAASSLTSPPAPGPRMKESDMPADPRNRLLDLVITNTTASVTLGEIEQMMQWSTRYEPMYGPLLEYLHSYQSIFVVSPVDDRVRLRRIFSIRTAEEVARRIKAGSPAAAIGAGGSGGVGLSASGAVGGGVGQSRRTTLRGGRRSRHDATPGPAAAAGGTSASHGAATGSRRAGRRTPSIGADRRSGKPSLPSAEALAAHIGSVSYSCVGEHLKLHTLETVYRRRGYDTAMMHGVLHVTNENDFHLFVFSSGAVVWWGMDRRDHWMVEDDFLSEATHITDGVEHRYGQAEIDALFPIWCSYEVDEQCEELQVASPLGIRSAAVTSSLERLATVLCFDHYLIPRDEPACSLVMLTFSHSLGRSARVDYFEHVTKGSHRHILSIPAELTGLLDYFSTKRRIAKLEGEIAVAQLAIQTIHDTPEVLWEVPWLQPYYDMVEQQNTAQSRLAWFASRSDTLLEQLSHIKGRRFRLFMLGSDVFLIVLLILDVMFMTSRLVAKMYFKVEEEE